MSVFKPSLKNAKVSIIIPTYNERENIVDLITDINKTMASKCEIIVVDDNSPDGTAKAVQNLQRKHKNVSLRLRPGKLGLSSAYLETMEILKHRKKEKPQIVISMDADRSHPVETIPAFIEALRNVDVVVGSRYVKGGGIENWPLHRRLLSRCGNFYVRTILRLGVNDATSGFMGMRMSALESVDLSEIRASGYAFLSEFKFNLHKTGQRFAEVPIIFRNRVHGKSKISTGIVKEGLFMPLQIWARNRASK